ncbi:F0F1 ATP synthase subunit delta [soil metagenome]
MADTADTDVAVARGSSRLARVYAESLAAAATAQGKTDDIGDELKDLVKSVFSNPTIAAYVRTPVISWRAKAPVLAESLGGRSSDLLRNFVGVLNKNGRLAMLPEIQQAYQSLRDKAAGRIRVTVKSAVALGQDQQSALAAKLAATLGKQPVLNLVVDPELLGGLVVQIGDRVLDASVRTRIQSLRAQLLDRGTSYVVQNQG